MKRKLLILGNSGSGKSTLASALCDKDDLSHLDLDTLAWQDTNPPSRQPLADSARQIRAFIDSHDTWVIEGCYSDLLQIAAVFANELIFLDLPVETCQQNARNRPWEPHKYQSREAQDANLSMLLDWIAQYPHRNDTFSRAAHRQLYDTFPGQKQLITQNSLTPTTSRQNPDSSRPPGQ